MPSERTFRKFARDAVYAAAAGVAIFMAGVLGDIELPGEVAPVGAAVALLLHRWGRGWLDGDPD